MINNNKKNFYKDKIDTLKKRESKIKQNILWLGILRFISFILFIVWIVFSVNNLTWVNIFFSAFWLFCFISLVIFHISQNREILMVRNLIKINHEELNALDYNFSAFNSGKQYIERNHAYAFDLDLFGEGSLFQLLNRTFTQAGEQLLAHKWMNPIMDKQKIEKIQKAIQELSDKIDWRQHLQATGKLVKLSENDNQKIKLWVNEPVYFINRWIFRFLVFVLPFFTLSFLVLFIFGLLHYSVFVFFSLLQLFFASTIMRKTNKEQRVVTEEIEILKNYHQIISIIENTSFACTELSDIKKGLFINENYSASNVLKKLIRIIDAFDTRLNLIVGLFLNATLMWDLLSLMRLERWKKNYGNHIMYWIKIIAQFDTYCSLANFRFNYPEFIFPQIIDHKVLEAKAIGHPLIHSEKRVNNDFIIEKPGQINIITGANMAGKSTFLRTIGINLILGLNGMPVCANEFKFKLMHLFSGMRTSDSLKENESYFYAELKRLKQIIEEIKSGKELFILLDEILKGTNSIDKAKGSKKFVEHLIELKATGIIATHDLTLCELEDKYPNIINNQCFEIEISGQQIFFDYKLRHGVTKNMNASVLMKQMGIFPCG
ncbi:MAG: MutS-related protein [Thiohalospira sp.]